MGLVSDVSLCWSRQGPAGRVLLISSLLYLSARMKIEWGLASSSWLLILGVFLNSIPVTLNSNLDSFFFHFLCGCQTIRRCLSLSVFYCTFSKVLSSFCSRFRAGSRKKNLNFTRFCKSIWLSLVRPNFLAIATMFSHTSK